MTTYRVQVTYEFVETHEVEAETEDDARAKYWDGDAEHADVTGGTVKRIRVVRDES